MADSFAQFQLLLPERLSDAVQHVEFTDVKDPAWNMIGMFKPEELGGKREFDTATSSFPSGYEAAYDIRVQSGGLVTGGNFAGNTLIQMGKDSHLAMGQGANAKYPDPRNVPMPSWIKIKMILKRIKGNVTVNKQQIISELAAKPLDEVAGDYALDAAKRSRNLLLNYLYGNGSASVAQVSGTPTVVETAGGTEITLSNGTFARFMKGDRVVAGSDADPRVQKTGAISGVMRVVKVNPHDRKINLQSEPGEGSIVLANGDHLMIEGTYLFGGASNAVNSLACQGFESLLLDSGVFPGSISPSFASGLNVTDHPELRAFVQDDSAAMVDPSMENLTLLLDEILDAGLEPPVAFISERGVWTLFSQIERDNHGMIQIPMGATFQASGGVAGPVLSHMEHRFQKFTSARIRPNALYGIAPDTFRRFSPMGDRAIHWHYGDTGNVFQWTTEGPQALELKQAPFDVFNEVGCDMPPRNLRRLGIRAQRDI